MGLFQGKLFRVFSCLPPPVLLTGTTLRGDDSSPARPSVHVLGTEAVSSLILKSTRTPKNC